MYRYELHMHTKEGSACAVSLVEDMIKQYVKIGFSGAVVTNHFIRGNTCVSRSLPWEQLIMQYSKAYTNGRKIAEELDFDLFFGIEEGYGNGKEFLAYGFEPEFLLSRPFLRNADLNIWAQEIHSVGGFIAYAHPFRNRDYITNPDEVPDISIVDGIEGYNRGNRDIDYSIPVYPSAPPPVNVKIHRIVEKESLAGKQIFIFGDPKHPEVQGICGWCHGPYRVLKNREDVENMIPEADMEACVVSCL